MLYTCYNKNIIELKGRNYEITHYCRKPSVGRDIAQALNINDKRNGYFENNKYIVTWALGHLVTNATPEQYDNNYKEWKLNDLPIIPNRMKTVVISKTKTIFYCTIINQ